MNKNKNLIAQLQEFGLNPHYWTLKKLKQRHRWVIIHKKEQDLCLLGTTEASRSWRDLEWLI